MHLLPIISSLFDSYKPETLPIRVTQTANSANTGRHLVEVMAYAQ